MFIAIAARLRQPGGLRVFLWVWLGQLFSVFGSGLTQFALGLWVYQQTGSVTSYSLISLAATLPRIFVSPWAGTLADRGAVLGPLRIDRRALMLLADLGSGVCTLASALLLLSGRLEVGLLYLLVALSAASSAFQWPAYSAATTQMVSPELLGRVNGLVQVSRAASGLLAPAAAGLLVMRIGVPGVMLIDFATFLFAVTTLVMVRFPPLPAARDEGARPSMRADLLVGWRFVLARPGLTALLLFVALFNFLWSMVGAMAAPLVLNFSSPQGLGLFVTVAGTGMLTGSLVMSAWGGPKRRILGVILFELLSGLCFVLMGLEPLWWRVALGAFGAHFTIAIIEGSNKSIWQAKVPAAMQGRVFAVWQVAALSAAPLAYLLAGPLADRVFEPLMQSAPGGWLAWTAAWVGVGPGRGIGLLFVMMGVLKVLTAGAGWLVKPVREI